MALLKPALALALLAIGLAAPVPRGEDASAPVPKGKDKLSKSMTSASGLTNIVQFRLQESVMPPAPSSRSARTTAAELATNSNLALVKAASVLTAALSAPTTAGMNMRTAAITCDTSSLQHVFRDAGECSALFPLPTLAPWHTSSCELRPTSALLASVTAIARRTALPLSYPPPPPLQASSKRSTKPPACT